MRLISRNRNRRRASAPRIAISQAEITADLHYPDSRPPDRREAGTARRGVAR
jgi:hypothetical protein